MPSATSGFTLYGDAPGAGADADPHDVGHSVVELPTGRIELAHPLDALDRIYRLNFGKDGTEPPYWAQPWPSGIELASVVARRDVGGARVLELGCGLALPSLAAAQGGARVLATDHAPGALAFAAHNAERNGIRLEVARCDWSDPWSAVAGAPWDLVLAADVLYDHGSLVALADLLPQLVRGTGEVWIADQDRPPAREFLDACRQWATVSTIDTAHPEVRVHRLRRRDC
ncbi:class I SAM-dependent methyltransferase [Pseudonocardia dioxanivorans]|jgi:predicted nicotinamide N-methyase|uniref:Methyltransferase type 12 n=1 Tax=Pseudonocardia dioxanivorans (strain ATCC 55486 / DSM 44775 / JCM 13855 / CB1190) TaxID=675635 RepID=F4CTL2_PSEUX|nr:methyltransferase domain-containing protein [Pseudonocardia dioxanivorans]AEA28515.1 Methyltransferase type 12 [Pseudonocardia dioxanivorans CB1190]